MTFELRARYALEAWQQDAVAAWLASEPLDLGRCHGILEIYTGAGKTVVALGAMAAISSEAPNTKFAVVVPTVALAQQWVAAVPERTTLPATRVGMVGGDCNDSFASKDVLVYVLASARKRDGGASLLARHVAEHEVMLVVDECHKAGAPSSSRIFDAVTTCRLGLSATPQREAPDTQDDLGQILPLERQPHGRALGGVCYRLGLRDGYERGMLPRYEIHHHGIALTSAERAQYDLLTHRVTQARQTVTRCGGTPEGYLGYLVGRGRRVPAELRAAAAALQRAYFERKQFLYQASERLRVVEQLLVDAWHDERLGPPRGAVLFNERIGDETSEEADDSADGELVAGAETLWTRVTKLAAEGALPFAAEAVALEHSRKSAADRQAALAGLRAGSVQVLVSVKALQEGIDIPDVGLGVSVASTASARQRIQTMGRILRPARDANGQRILPERAPTKRLHLLYVRDTVDEEIYKRTDWNDETGADRNHWWTWDVAGDKPTSGDVLIPIEVDEPIAWERIKHLALPQPWTGPTNVLPLVNRGGEVFVHSEVALPISVATEVIALLEAGKRTGAYPDARGGFKVTPELQVVLKRGTVPAEPAVLQWLALGRLTAPPTWPEKGQNAAPPGDPSADNAQRSPVPPMTDSRGTREPWFVTLQEGFLAARRNDAVKLREVCHRLRGERRAWVDAAMETLAAGEPSAFDGCEQPPNTLEALLPFVAAAYVSGRADLVDRANETFRVGNAQKPKRIAIANALAILAGRTEQIWRPTAST